ncbi:MAG: division plane positioning ATPase MipZ [Alphaproteobacteria bacterium]
MSDGDSNKETGPNVRKAGQAFNFAAQMNPKGRKAAIAGKPHVIVLGNEKGGSGKSTTAMHITAALMKLGFSVGLLDLDGRQRSLSRYVENRGEYAQRHGLKLPMPRHHVLMRSELDSMEDRAAAELAAVQAALDDFADCQFIVIDCPGSDTHLSRLGHSLADTLVTPINDSFVDFDLIGKVDPETYEVKSPSLYAELVWDSRKQRMMRDRTTVDWVVMRNRLQQLDAKNKRRVGEALTVLADRIGFRVAPGFGERVIYRELFLNGLTLIDLVGADTGVNLTMSHVAARNEVRGLIESLNLPGLEGRLAEL